MLQARHIAGVDNQTANIVQTNSKGSDRLETESNNFLTDCGVLGPPSCGYVCNPTVHPSPPIYSWKPEPKAEATDTYLQDWSQIHEYANPACYLYL